MAGKENPLIVHSIVLMVAGVAVAAWGVVGIVRGASAGEPEAAAAAPAEPGAEGAAPADGETTETATKTAPKTATKKPTVAGATKTVQDIQKTKMDASTLKNFGKRPTLGGATAALGSASRLAGKMGGVTKVLLPILLILAGIATGIMGFFVLKRKNWARYVGFGLLASLLLYFIVLQSGPGGIGNPHNDMGFPIAAMIIVTLLAAKFLWDLWVEKLEAA